MGASVHVVAARYYVRNALDESGHPYHLLVKRVCGLAGHGSFARYAAIDTPDKAVIRLIIFFRSCVFVCACVRV